VIPNERQGIGFADGPRITSLEEALPVRLIRRAP